MNLLTAFIIDVSGVASSKLPRRFLLQPGETENNFLRRVDYFIWKSDREQVLTYRRGDTILILVDVPGMGHDFD